jgi:hypothetical protein
MSTLGELVSSSIAACNHFCVRMPFRDHCRNRPRLSPGQRADDRHPAEAGCRIGVN